MDEVKPEEADLEFITSILESVAKLGAISTQNKHKPEHQNCSPDEVNYNALLKNCTKNQAMLLNFNYKAIIKTPVYCSSSYESTTNLETLEKWSENIELEEPEFLKVKELSTISMTRNSTFLSAWHPFIPSNTNGAVSLGSHTGRSSPQSSSPSPRSFLQKLQHNNFSTDTQFTANLWPRIYSVACSQTGEIRNWKRHSSPVDLARPTNLWPNAPLRTTTTSTWSSKARKFYTSKWSRSSPELIGPPRKLVSWQNKSQDHLGQLKQSRIWMPPLQGLPQISRLWTTKPPAMQPEINAGDMLLPSIQSPFKTCCYMISEHAWRKTNYWVRKLRELYHKTKRWPNKLLTFMTLPQKN